MLQCCVDSSTSRHAPPGTLMPRRAKGLRTRRADRARDVYHGHTRAHRAADAQRAMSPRPPRPPRELPLLAGTRLKNASIKDRNRVFNEQEFLQMPKKTFERCNSTKKLYRAGQLYANFTMPHFVGPTDGDLIIRARSRRTIMGCRIAANGMVSCPRAYTDEAYTIEFAYAFDGHFEALKLHPPQCAPRGQVEILTQENGTNVPLQLSNVRPLPPLCAPSQIPSTTGSWYDAEWIPTNCRIRYTKTKTDRRVLLVGDSHQRQLENYLQSLDVNASYIGSTGIMNRNFTNFTKNCTQTLSPGTDDAGLLQIRTYSRSWARRRRIRKRSLGHARYISRSIQGRVCASCTRNAIL